MANTRKFGESTLSGQVTRAVKTLREMLLDRGWDDQGLAKLGDEACAAAVAVRETIEARLAPDTLLVMYTVLKQSGSSVRSDLKRRLDRDAHRRVILVFREVPTNADSIAAKLREDMGGLEHRIVVEVFSLAELQYNVSRHVLVPRHERIPAASQDVQAILKGLGARKAQLPAISSRADPMCRYLGAEPGDLIKITRVSPTAGEHVVYRCCI